MNYSKIGYCSGGAITPPELEVIIYDRDCEFCDKPMKQYQEKFGFDIQYFYICENPFCDEGYDIEIAAETYYNNCTLIVE